MKKLLTQPHVLLTYVAVFLLGILQCLRNNCAQKMNKVKLSLVNCLIWVVFREV